MSGKTRVLVVDDEAAIREITKETLESHGYNVITASDGAEAVAVYAEARGGIDVVLTDMTMPLMDGNATIRALQRIDPDARIVAMSGFVGELQLNPDARVRAVLRKPYTAADVLNTLRVALEGASA